MTLKQGAFWARWSQPTTGREAPEGHQHVWRRLPDSIGLFFCADTCCYWGAVCPTCLGSLDVALQAQEGIWGLALYWCPEHGGQ